MDFSPYNTGMFIKPCYKKSNGKKLAYWSLVESYRTANGPRQRIVAYLGQLKDTTRRGVTQAAENHDKPQFVQARLVTVLSHILVCFSAYVLWTTLGCMVKRSGTFAIISTINVQTPEDAVQSQCCNTVVSTPTPQ